MIMAFDTRTEQFSMIPPHPGRHRWADWKILEMDGRLCFSCSTQSTVKNWALEEKSKFWIQRHLIKAREIKTNWKERWRIIVKLEN